MNQKKYQNIELLSVNYNTPELIYRQYVSIRHYLSETIPIRIIDGSDQKQYKNQFLDLERSDENFKVNRIGFNIHHGKGMDFGIKTSD